MSYGKILFLFWIFGLVFNLLPGRPQTNAFPLNTTKPATVFLEEICRGTVPLQDLFPQGRNLTLNLKNFSLKRKSSRISGFCS